MSTVQPPKADTPKNGQHLRGGQAASPDGYSTSNLELLTSGQRTCRAFESTTMPHKSTSEKQTGGFGCGYGVCTGAAQRRPFPPPTCGRVCVSRRYIPQVTVEIKKTFPIWFCYVPFTVYFRSVPFPFTFAFSRHAHREGPETGAFRGVLR